MHKCFLWLAPLIRNQARQPPRRKRRAQLVSRTFSVDREGAPLPWEGVRGGGGSAVSPPPQTVGAQKSRNFYFSGKPQCVAVLATRYTSSVGDRADQAVGQDTLKRGARSQTPTSPTPWTRNPDEIRPNPKSRSG